jgi:hypothetical protein
VCPRARGNAYQLLPGRSEARREKHCRKEKGKATEEGFPFFRVSGTSVKAAISLHTLLMVHC